MKPLQILFDAGGEHELALPAALANRYGSFSLPSACLFANFVASIDGVVALGRDDRSSGSLISGKADADRFVMGLLRACADAVLIGAGTLRGSPGHIWDAAHVYPELREEFSALRRNLSRSDQPILFLVTASGEIDVRHPGIAGETVIITTGSGAAKLQGRVGENVDVLVAGEGDGGEDRISVREVMEIIHARGCKSILSEAGPNLFAQLLQERLVDELFLTVAPVVLGRNSEKWRPGVADGVVFPPDSAPNLKLMSARRDDSMLFLRYSIT